MFASRSIRLFSVVASLFLVFSMISVDTAEARRGGSFGGRGTRTFQSAPTTQTAPNQMAPVQRSMTPQTGTQQPGAAPSAAAARQQQGMFGGGFGGAMMRGLFLGGIFGLFMGAGFGGFGGLLSMLFQILLIGGIIFIVMRMFGARRPATAGGPGNGPRVNPYQAYGNTTGGSGGYSPQRSQPKSERRWANDEIGVTEADLGDFERLLIKVQEAYSREDFDELRRMTTPEVMSYLSEELGQNAAKGLRNEVSDVTLLSGDVAESWREGEREYATVALRYSSLDVTRERATGAVVEGNADAPSEAVELWTFTRAGTNGKWQLSAIQSE